MKKYILLTYAITNIGGSQIYTRNKAKYLKERGWDVDVYSYQDGNIYIDDLIEYKSGIIKELKYPVFYFTKGEIKRILKKKFSQLKNHSYSELIIETNSIGLATWGEYLAKYLNCKHIIYLLAEHYSSNQDTYNFLSFKNQRKELAAAHTETLQNLFSQYNHDLNNSELVSLRANCTNVVEDIYHPLINKINTEYITIGSIGRLEKPFLKSNLLELRKYFETNKEQKYNLILIGGSPKSSKCVNTYKKIFRDTNNVNLFITGYIYPIPLKLLQCVDVFISSAGSAYLSYKYGIPTISIDSQTYLPIGILGVSTFKSTFGTVENKKYNLFDLLDEILTNTNKYSGTGITKSTEKLDYSSHLDFIKNSNQNKAYYPLNNIKLKASDMIKKYILTIFGVKTLKFISVLRLKFAS